MAIPSKERLKIGQVPISNIPLMAITIRSSSL